MKQLFKNKTKYSKSLYDDFLSFHLKTFKLKYFIFSLFISILLFICMTLQVKYHNYTLALIFFIILLCFFVFRYIKPQKEVRKTLESDAIINEKEFKFIFYQKQFYIIDDNKYNTIRYFDLYKIFETPNYFYLYLDKSHSFIINKKTFLKGDPISFRTFFKKNYPFKYSYREI